MSSTKVFYIISDIDKALAFEWIARGLREKCELHFILIGKQGSKFSAFLKNNSIAYDEVSDLNYPSRAKKWIRIFSILRKEKPSVVHTHLWNANLFGLSAAWLLGIKKRVYTRHHALTHYRDFPAGRKWDLLCNRMATHIIAISAVVKHILVDYDKADPDKIVMINHGFDLPYFFNIENDRVDTIRRKYVSSNHYPVIGVVARYMDWKGIQFIIPAFKKIVKDFPDAHLVLANAQGNYSDVIHNLLKELPSESFTEIPFEDDIAALYKVFDVYVHVPVDAESEAFGQTYVEALAAGVPSVFTLSGVASEFVKDGINALVVPHKDPESIAVAVNKILTDDQLRSGIISRGKESVINTFDLQTMIDKLEQTYVS